MPDHFYTTDPKEELALAAGYEFERLECYVKLGQEPTSVVSTFRCFNKGNFDHFYTTDRSQGNRARDSFGYTPEFIGWYMFPPPIPRTQARSRQDQLEPFLCIVVSSEQMSFIPLI